jgi:hypothetical protein
VTVKLTNMCWYLWVQEKQHSKEPYKVSELTPVYGCCMGLNSDIPGCRYCLCQPCKMDGENASARTKRVDKTLKEKLKDKKLLCEDLQQRHHKINLLREQNANYFRQTDTGESNYPAMCSGCMRPFTA